jgi:hypothetical protein
MVLWWKHGNFAGGLIMHFVRLDGDQLHNA